MIRIIAIHRIQTRVWAGAGITVQAGGGHFDDQPSRTLLTASVEKVISVDVDET
jgi:hypothetical protein